MSSFATSLDALGQADLSNLAAVEALLHTRFGIQKSEGVITVHTARGGRLGTLQLRDVELRNRADSPLQGLLILHLADAGPELGAYQRAHMPDASFVPSRAAAMPDYWTQPIAGGKLSVGAVPGSPNIATVVLDRMP